MQDRLVDATPVAAAAAATAPTRPAATSPTPRPAASASRSATATADPDGPGLVASGSFGALEHDTSGRAEIVRTAEGKQQLQLRDFKTDAGPDLRVYLATDTGAGDFVDLGKLKGNSGNQVYGLPGTVDLKKYDTVVIWCRAFTVGFGQAALR